MSKIEKRRRRLRNLKIREISFVDDPAVPDAKFVICKRREFNKNEETRTTAQTTSDPVAPNEGSPLTTAEQSAETVIKTAVEILLKVSSAMPAEMVSMVKQLADMLGMGSDSPDTTNVAEPDVAKAVHAVEKSLSNIVPTLVDDAREVIQPIVKAIQEHFPVQKDSAVTVNVDDKVIDAVAKLQESVAALAEAVGTGTHETPERTSTKPEAEQVAESTTSENDVDFDSANELLAVAEQILQDAQTQGKENTQEN